jgi:hypothetical protein
MTLKKELKMAYGLAIILLVVGVISYAAFPAKAPEEPVRVMYKVVAGKVLFEHKAHTAESGYGLSCSDCHHHPEDPEDEEESLLACGVCHQIPAEGEAFPQVCNECHEPDEIEDSEITKRADAFHSQCEECHKESDIGPVEDDERCSWCHFM